MATNTMQGRLVVAGPLAPGTGSVDYAASITPNCDSYSTLLVGTLSGNITVNAPTGTPSDNQTLVFRFLQDGTGGRTISFDSGTNGFAFGTELTSAGIPTTASKYVFCAFRWVAALSKWVHVGRVGGIS